VVVLVSMVALRGSRLPRRLGWLGVMISVVGLASIVPPLNDATVVFGLLEIAWFAWLGLVLLRTHGTTPHDAIRADDSDMQFTEAQR
jgi:hypothetical protein